MLWITFKQHFTWLTLGCTGVTAEVHARLIAFVCVLVSILRFMSNSITDITLRGGCHVHGLTLLHALHVTLGSTPTVLGCFFFVFRTEGDFQLVKICFLCKQTCFPVKLLKFTHPLSPHSSVLTFGQRSRNSSEKGWRLRKTASLVFMLFLLMLCVNCDVYFARAARCSEKECIYIICIDIIYTLWLPPCCHCQFTSFWIQTTTFACTVIHRKWDMQVILCYYF